MTSRVVPGTGVTIAASRRATRFIRLDFPALGGPAMATTRPSRRRSPRRSSMSAAAISWRSVRALARVGKIDARLDQRQRLDQPRPPRLGAPAQASGVLAVGLASLRLGLRVDQI